MGTFVDALEAAINGVEFAFTENGAVAYKTSGSALVDFFGTGAALRTRSTDDIVSIFSAAFKEDALLATKAAFYIRDVREGQGERSTFRQILRYLGLNHPEVVRKNLHLIADYGRWDDLFALFSTPVEDDVITLFDVQLASDLQSDTPSLLAKWLKSENTSSKGSRALAYKTRKGLNMSSKAYRRILSTLRARIHLVEQDISAGKWSNIDYSKLPSRAGFIYRDAFKRHDPEGYNAFLASVEKGETKINAGTLYPYDLVHKYYENSGGWGGPSSVVDPTIEAMWKNLPNYFDGTENRGIVVADVSGSMYGRPIEVAISLAIYCAERISGPFAGKFITFSARPSLQSIVGTSLADKIVNLHRAHWDMNTNVKAVFDLILSTAIKQKASQEDLPSHLYIVSDMEFDHCGGSNVTETLFETIKAQYQQAGYNMPALVFWNVNSRNQQQPVRMDDRGVCLVSGCSPTIFKNVAANRNMTARDVMLDILEQPRYSAITV